MELEIYNPTKENTVKQIDWNFEERNNRKGRNVWFFGVYR